ncbi:MAG TPA: class I SAM-dependent methyltransferase [Gaiellaceae bacterium]|nr:class I SAM-dependent methyltransferase [Gaiellaceae bacterium]
MNPGSEEPGAHWLLVRGRGERRLEPEVRADELRAHSSTRRPRVRVGDRALLYAAGWQVLFGAVRVVSEPEEVEPPRVRWRWRFRIEPEVALSDLREAPPVQAAGVLTTSVGRHSYVRLTEEQFRSGRAAVVAAIVASGYDRIADRFAAWQREIAGSRRLEWLERLLALLPRRPDVLELGVGAGVRSSRILAERGRLTGVDVSEEQLRRARERLPGTRLLQADVATVSFPEASFDAVVSFYVLNNLPQDELGPLLARVAGWLRPGGWFLASLPARDNPGWTGDFLGTEMFFAGHAPERNEELVREAGLDVVDSQLETIVELGYGRGTWHWLLARRPRSK